jgi:hypothetical protein
MGREEETVIVEEGAIGTTGMGPERSGPFSRWTFFLIDDGSAGQISRAHRADEKTGAQRQADLVKLAAGFAAPAG